MPLSEFNETEDAAARVLFARHGVSAYNSYGRCVGAGYQVAGRGDGVVRVAHRIPESDLLNDDRPSDDELAAERHRMVDAYAATLEAAGWTVQRRGPRSRNPHLLASR